MKYAFFSDIDGTIYNHKQIVLQSTKDDVSFAQKNDVEFIIATGNGYFDSIKKIAETLNIRYLILSNGAQIFDYVNKMTIYQNLIPQHLGQKILNIGIKFNLTVLWWDEKGVYFGPKSQFLVIEKIKKFIHQNNIHWTKEVKDNIYKIEFIGEEKNIDKALEFLKDLPLNLIRMHPLQLEIVNENVSKGHAIEKFCVLFNLSLKNVGAIGDSHNDLEMLSVVAHSYAMLNGHANTLKAARYQAKHVLDNGVGHALRDFINKIT